jgi:hypothetical protein
MSGAQALSSTDRGWARIAAMGRRVDECRHRVGALPHAGRAGFVAAARPPPAGTQRYGCVAFTRVLACAGPDRNFCAPLPKEQAMTRNRTAVLGGALALALTVAPISSAIAGGGHHGGGYGHGGYAYGGYGYGFNPVYGLATALVGVAAAVVTAPIAILAAVANAPYYGPGPGYPAAPAAYGVPPVAQGYDGAVGAAYYAGPVASPAYYVAPPVTYYNPPVAAYYGAPAPAYYAAPAAAYYGPPRGRGYYAPVNRGYYGSPGRGYYGNANGSAPGYNNNVL